MTKNVIHLFGASGSGTTTLGQKISDELGFVFIDTDDCFWLPTDPPYSQKRPREERVAIMRDAIENASNVVISGSLVDWGDELIPMFTLAIRLETNPEVRMERLEKRERERFGSRINVGGDMYQNHIRFMEWATAYDAGGLDMRSKAKHDEWQKLLDCEVLMLNGAEHLDQNYSIIRQHIIETEGATKEGESPCV